LGSVRQARHLAVVIASDSTGESVAVAGGTVVVVTVAVLGASTTDDTGPILAFVGAVLVALIAAFTAGRRQARALKAESGRLAQQLEHDRELADLADTRALFDEAVVALQDADEVRHRATQAVFQHGQWTGERAPDAVQEVAVIATSLGPIRQRLAVRFGDEHDAVRGVHAVQLALREVAHLLSLPPDHADVRESWTATQHAAKRFEDTRAELVRIAVRAVGARLP
jgi:hypothetical protein